MNDPLESTPAVLYARVFSERQDVDLSVATQLRVLRDYADKNGYLIVREYIDKAESRPDASSTWRFRERASSTSPRPSTQRASPP